jgi:hypothetical protein
MTRSLRCQAKIVRKHANAASNNPAQAIHRIHLLFDTDAGAANGEGAFEGEDEAELVAVSPKLLPSSCSG